MNVIEIVKAKLPSDKLPEEALLDMYVEEVRQTILTYLNRTDMPPELAFTHANMVVDVITGESRKVDPDAAATVKSVKEGDVTVQFGSTNVESRERATQTLLFDYSKQLNKFRKLRW